MAHFAKLDSTCTVVAVTRGRDEDSGTELEICARTGETYRQTSYNTSGGVHYNPETGEPSEDQSKGFRKNFAGVGYRYDADRDAFIPPKPYPSWSLNETTCLWDPPVARPDDGQPYIWNETEQRWDTVTSPE
jgi:hypothetical protein